MQNIRQNMQMHIHYVKVKYEQLYKWMQNYARLCKLYKNMQHKLTKNYIYVNTSQEERTCIKSTLKYNEIHQTLPN